MFLLLVLVELDLDEFVVVEAASDGVQLGLCYAFLADLDDGFECVGLCS